MNYNAAICYVLAGIGLCFWARRGTSEAVAIFGGVIVFLGSVTMAEYLFRTDLGIDELFFHSRFVAEVPDAGRMSPISAFCFVLIGLALIALSTRKTWRGQALAVGLLASVIINIAGMALLGYIIGLPGAHGGEHLTRIAAHTAAGLGLAGAILFVIAWNLALRPGEITPRWLPVPVTLGIFAASLVLYFALEGNQQEDAMRTIRAGADAARDQVALRMDARIRSFVRMARQWEIGGAASEAAWRDDAATYLHDFPEVQALEWMDNTHRIKWVLPLAGNEGKLNQDLTIEPNRKAAVDRVEQDHNPAITGIVTLFHGGLGFVIYVPVMIDGRMAGIVGAVFKAQPCLDRYLPPAVADGEAIRIAESRQTFYERDASSPPLRPDWAVKEKVELPGATWAMTVWPTQEFASRLWSPLPLVVLGFGTLGSLLLGVLCFLGQRASRHTAEIARTNAALQEALDNVKTLQGLLPICSSCKRVRDDTGYWNQIDTYIHAHTNASLSHGYCPECAAKAFRECGFEVPENVQAEIEAGRFEKAQADMVNPHAG